jgi:transketolase C-terminal domain/subunit
MDENAVGTCAELVFAPIDASFADDAPLLPSGFRIIPLDSAKEASSPNRTLDLTSALETGPVGSEVANVLIENRSNIPFKKIGIPDKFPDKYGSQSSLMSEYKITSESLVKSVVKLLK